MNECVRKAITEAIKASRRKALHDAAINLRFAWVEGYSTLYRFMGLGGERFGYVADVLENSRIYLSSPDQLNDPADCRPIFKLAKPLSDPDFVRELEEDEKRMIAEEKLTPEQVTEARLKHGVRVEDLARSITEHTQQMLQRVTRVYCMTAARHSIQMWGYYADAHSGVCLHFHCESGSLIGMARRVVYSEVRQPILVPIHYNNAEDVPDRMVFTKAQGWQHEREYRIVAHEGVVGDEFRVVEGRYVQFSPDLLTGITFGSRITEDDRNRLLTIIARRRASMSVFQATLGDGFSVAVNRLR